MGNSDNNFQAYKSHNKQAIHVKTLWEINIFILSAYFKTNPSV